MTRKAGLGEFLKSLPVVDKQESLEKKETKAAKETPKEAEKPQFLTLPLPPDLAARLYSEVFHDPLRRLLKDVALEILQDGFAKRPRKDPAPPEFIARFKAKGKR